MKHFLLTLLFSMFLVSGARAQLTFYGDCSTPINARPNNVSAQAVGHHKATISWQGVPGAKGYAVNVGLADIDPKGWPTFLTCDPNVEYTVEGLTPGQTYRARVRTLCGDCGKNGGPTVSPWSFVVEFKTPNDPQTPAGPSNPVTNAPDPTPFDFDLSVKVVNRFYEPVAGAEVKVGSQTLTTDAKGEARANGLRGSRADRSLVSASHPDYLPQWRGFLPTGPALQYAQIMLTPKEETHGFMSDKGGTMTATGFWLTIPPDAVVDENGQPYSGRVGVQMDGVRPSDVDFGLRMPGGDFYALDASGQPSILYSYGFFGVELRGDAGQRLNLAAGKKATVRLLIDEEQRAEAPANVPLWHFDEAAGHWRHAGDFAREGKFYVAEVEHFSWWNCDYRGPIAWVKGRVVNCDGSPAVGVQVPFGQLWSCTDNNGEFLVFVAAGVELYAQLEFADGSGRLVGPFSNGAQTELPAPFVFSTMSLRSTVFQAWYFAYQDEPQSNHLFVAGGSNYGLDISLDGGATYTQHRSHSLSPQQVPREVNIRYTCGTTMEITIPVLHFSRKSKDTQTDCVDFQQATLSSLPVSGTTTSATYLSMILRTWSLPSEPDAPSNRMDLSCPCANQVSFHFLGSAQVNLGYVHLPTNLRSIYFGLQNYRIIGVPKNIEELPFLESIYLSVLTDTSFADISFLSRLPSTTNLVVEQYDKVNFALQAISSMPKLSKLTFSKRSAQSEDINIPASFADLADTLEELDLSGCAPIDPAEQQRIQSLLPNTTIIW